MAEVDIHTMWKKLTGKTPFIISGPCSAETEKQVLETAHRLAETGKVNLLRAGIWKPRTKPGNFEGIGESALPWLEKARNITGLPFAVEVATAEHVEQALKHKVDVLWIGSRTTANPFSVQEIADALKGVTVPVFVKNPINPDLNLWLGGLERIEKAGIKHLGAIHRGFSNYGNPYYRNAPMWHIPIELRRQTSDLPILCDPSHISGRREILQEVIQKAIDLGFDGLMIEAHISPNDAWSDSQQQITPAQLEKLLRNVVWRQEANNPSELNSLLSKYREQINQIDEELITLFDHRMKLVEEIGSIKKEKKITILQVDQWRKVFDAALKKGNSVGLSEKFIAQLFDIIHIESINHQDYVMNKNKDQ